MASAYIAWYLFFAGAGAGAFAIASVVDFALRLAPRPRLLKISPITDAGMVLGPIMVAAGCVFLLLDLGDPSIAFNVFLRPSSILGFGSWAIVLFCLFAALSLVFGLMPHCRASKLIEPLSQFLAMILSFVVILYSGVFYSLFPSVPFLNTPLVPALFTASAFSSGAGLLVVVGFFRQTCEGVLEGMNGLSAIDAVIVLVEILLLTALLARPVLFSESDASLSAFALLFGDLSLLFLGGCCHRRLCCPFGGGPDVLCSLTSDCSVHWRHIRARRRCLLKVLYSYGSIEVCDWFCCRATILGLAHNIEKGNRVRKEGGSCNGAIGYFPN